MSENGASASARYPRPLVNRDYAFFYDAISAGRLDVQECASCRGLRYPPAPMCPKCNCLLWDQRTLRGTGALFSYTVHYHPPIAGYDGPIPVGLVEMDEGVRLMAGLHGIALDEIEIGMKLRLDFPEVEPGYVLHRFVRDDEQRGGESS